MTRQKSPKQPPYTLKTTKKYRQGRKKYAAKTPKIKEALGEVLSCLKNQKHIDNKYNNHPLGGDKQGLWRVHLVGSRYVLEYYCDHTAGQVWLVYVGVHPDDDKKKR